MALAASWVNMRLKGLGCFKDSPVPVESPDLDRRSKRRPRAIRRIGIPSTLILVAVTIEYVQTHLPPVAAVERKPRPLSHTNLLPGDSFGIGQAG